jgi:ABC-type polysaccharide/polyol phosphate export permease
MIGWFKELYNWREFIFTISLIDIRQRYRRSELGVWWNLITLSVTMCTLSYIWSNIFKIDLKSYLPYFATSYIIWNFIIALVNEGANTFIASEALIRQSNIPLQIHLARVILRNIMILGINSLILVIIFILTFHVVSIFNILLAIIGLLLVLMFIVPLLIAIAIACARFRDLPQLVSNIMQMMFFITPILWEREILSENHKWVVDWNPLLLMLDAIRGPLLNRPLDNHYYLKIIIGIIFTIVIGSISFARYKKRLPYWA